MSRLRRRSSHRWLMAVAALGLCAGAAGCADRHTDPPTAPTAPRAVASIAIEPGTLSLEPGQTRALQAVVRDSTGATLTDRTVQWQSSTPSIATVTAAASGGAIANVVAISAGSTTISASVEGRTASLSLVVTSPSASEFAIVDAQWTQGTQLADGTIPMVLNGIGAVLNVRLSSTAALRAPGAIVVTLTDANGTRVHVDSVKPTPFAGTAGAAEPTAQFLVPSAVLRAGLRWRVQRDPSHSAVDSDSTNDVWPRTGSSPLATVTLPTMRIRFVPVSLSAHNGITGNVFSGNVEGYLQTLRRIMPLGQLETSIRGPLVSSANFGTTPRGGAESFWIQALQDVDLARVADPTAGDTYWMGVIAPPAGFTFTNFGGYSYIPANAAATGAGTRSSTVVQIGWFTNTGQTTDLVAHELSHVLGRRHAPCGGATGTDPNFPDASGSIGSAGFDVYAWSSGQASNAPVRAASMADVMGYCFPVWISPYTYANLLNARQASAPVAVVGTSSSHSVSMTRQSVLVVRAVVRDDSVSVLPTVELTGIPTVDDGGTYRVTLRDAAGRVLATQRTHAVAVDHATARTLLVAFPASAALAATVAQVQVSGPGGSSTRRGLAAAWSASAAVLRTPSFVQSASPSEAFALETGADNLARCPAGALAITVQDHDTGELLATAHADHVALPDLAAHTIDISCSDGVRSVHAKAVPTGLRRSPFGR